MNRTREGASAHRPEDGRVSGRSSKAPSRAISSLPPPPPPPSSAGVPSSTAFALASGGTLAAPAVATFGLSMAEFWNGYHTFHTHMRSLREKYDPTEAGRPLYLLNLTADDAKKVGLGPFLVAPARTRDRDSATAGDQIETSPTTAGGTLSPRRGTPSDWFTCFSRRPRR